MKCAVCGIDDYWVGYDSGAKENRCMNHLSVWNRITPEEVAPTSTD